MSKPILILKNITREGPGMFHQFFAELGVPYEILNLDAGDTLPTSLATYRAVIMLGGPQNVSEGGSSMAAKISWLRSMLHGELHNMPPYLGVCLGMQMLAAAAGGQVGPGECSEAGFIDEHDSQYAVTLTDAGQTDQLFAGVPSSFTTFQLHGEMVQRSPNYTVLATGAWCPVQAIRVGERAWGTQFHFELTDQLLDVWCHTDPLLKDVAARRDVHADFVAIREHYEQTRARIIENFLAIAGT